jgi:hypothetical protein
VNCLPKFVSYTLLFVFVSPGLLFAQSASIQGIVTRSESNDPLSKATVELRAEENQSAVLSSVTTDDDGRFVFQAVRPGRYRLTVRRAGYTRSPLSIVVAAGQAPSAIRLPMKPTAAISGNIFDSSGQPLGNVLVQALKPAYPSGARILTSVQSVMTNDLGEYRLYWLPPGRYYVAAFPRGAEPSNFGMFRQGGFGLAGNLGGNNFRFFASADTDPAVVPETAREPVTDTSDDRFAPVYFAGTTADDAATPIDLRAGADFTGINIVVTPVREHHVRGVILDGTGKPAQYASLSAVDDVLVPQGPRTAPEVNPDTGVFDIALLPGNHTLRAGSASGSGYAIVRVGETDVENVTIATMPAFDISGRMTVEGRTGSSTDLGQLRITLVRNARSLLREPESKSYSSPLANGTFKLSGGVGDYRVAIAPILNLSQYAFPMQLPSSLQNAYVKSIRLGNIDVLNNGLRLERVPENVLEIVLATDPGAVEGTAGMGDITVALLPDARQRTELYRSTTTDNVGNFRFDKIPPGDYRIFAWTEVDNGSWYDTEFMRNYEGRGIAVRVREDSRESVRIEPIP